MSDLKDIFEFKILSFTKTNSKCRRILLHYVVVILDTFLYPQLQVCSMPKSDARLAQQTHQLKTHLSYWTFWYQKKRILVPKKISLQRDGGCIRSTFTFWVFIEYDQKNGLIIFANQYHSIFLSHKALKTTAALWYTNTYSTPPSSPVKYLAKYQSLGPENCRVFAKEEERGHTCHCCRHLLPQSILSLFKKDIPTHLRSLGSSVPIRLNITFTH